MNRGQKNLQLTVLSCFAAAFLFFAVTPVQTYPPFLAKAKQLGLPAQDCTYCHVNASGGEPFNARGNWLVAEKEKRSASAVDVAWLKEYKEEGESKGKDAEEKKTEEKKTEEPPAADKKNDPGSAASAEPMTGGKRRGQKVTSAAASTVAVGRGPEPVRALSASMKGNEIAARLGNDRPGFNYVVTGAEMVDGKLQLKGMIKPAQGGAGESASAILVGTLSRARNPWPSANDSQAAARTRAANNNNAAAQQGAAATTGGNPAPAAGQTQQQGRETRNPENTAQLGSLSQSTQPTARTTQTPTAPQGQRPSAGEANEQSQSLYSGDMAVGLGCEIIYLKMKLPAKMAAAAQTQGQPVQVGVVLAPTDNKSGEEINNQLCRVVHAMSSVGGGGDAQAQIDQLNRLLASNGGSASAGRGGR